MPTLSLKQINNSVINISLFLVLGMEYLIIIYKENPTITRNIEVESLELLDDN